MDLNQKKLYCQLIAQLVLIDGAVTDAEHQFLNAAMNRLGLDAEDRRDVINNVNVDDDVEAKARALDPVVLRELTAELEQVAEVDGDVSPGERDIIARIKGALDL